MKTFEEAFSAVFKRTGNPDPNAAVNLKAKAELTELMLKTDCINREVITHPEVDAFLEQTFHCIKDPLSVMYSIFVTGIVVGMLMEKQEITDPE